MQAAFIDIGMPKAAYLHSSDIGTDYGRRFDSDEGEEEEAPAEIVRKRRRQAIESVLKRNQEILVQVFKEVEWEDLFVNEGNRNNLFWAQKSSPRKHFLEMRFDKGIPYIPSSLTTGQKVFDLIYSRLLYANFQSANDFDNLKIPFRA